MKFLCCLILMVAFFLPKYMEERLSYFDFFKLFFKSNPVAVLSVALMTLIAFFLMNFLISILVRIWVSKIEKDNKEYLKSFWQIFQAKIENIEKDLDSERRGSKYYWIISLKSEKRFFEKTLKKDPFGYIDFGDTVNLFVDPDDQENYYLEVDELFDVPKNIARMQLERWKSKSRFKFEE